MPLLCKCVIRMPHACSCPTLFVYTYQMCVCTSDMQSMCRAWVRCHLLLVTYDPCLTLCLCNGAALQACCIYGQDVFRKWDGRKHHGAAVEVNLWDVVMLTLATVGYSKADLQPHADKLHSELLKLKLDSKFIAQPRQEAPRTTFSKSQLKSRIWMLQTSIENVRGVDTPLHADQRRLFSSDIKVSPRSDKPIKLCSV